MLCMDRFLYASMVYGHIPKGIINMLSDIQEAPASALLFEYIQYIYSSLASIIYIHLPYIYHWLVHIQTEIRRTPLVSIRVILLQ